MSWVLLAEIGAYAIGWGYHRWFDKPESPQPQDEIQIPQTANGTPYTITYGRCRVKEPVLAWAGHIDAPANPGGLDGDTYWQGAPFLYESEFLYNIGIGFEVYNTQPNNHVYSIYAGDIRIPDGPYPLLEPPADYARLSELDGNGSYEGADAGPRPCFVWGHYDLAEEKGSEWEIGGLVEFYNGRADQQLIDATGLIPSTVAGERIQAMGLETSLVNKHPGYRGMLSIFLGGQSTRWGLGSTGRVPAYSFEVGSYANLNYGGPMIGVEANPVDCLLDILTGKRGKLGLPMSMIDNVSFQAASDTVYSEGNGYSRAWSPSDGGFREFILEILRQIDGALYFDHKTGKIKLKLIRADFDASTIPRITPQNAVDVQNVGAVGWAGAPNRFDLVFRSRLKNYEDDSVSADNEANAYSQALQVEPITVQMPGCCTAENARKLVAREASAESRPLMRLHAILDRSFAGLNPGDPVSMTWPNLQIYGRTFRVATPLRGDRNANTVEVDLIEDFFYTHRADVSGSGGLPSHPGGFVG